MLDEVSLRAADERADTDEESAADVLSHANEDSAGSAPESMLWAALSLAPEHGISVPDLVNRTGMSRRWVYYRLRELADAGRAVQTEQGNWRATEPDGDVP